MTQATDLDALTKAARRYEFADGLSDLLVAAAFLIFGLLNWALFSTNGLSWYAWALVHYRTLTLLGLIGLLAIVIGGPFLIRRWIDRLRVKGAWQARGFVKPLRLAAGAPIMIASVMAALALIGGAAWLAYTGRAESDLVLRSLVAAVGLSTGIVYAGLGWTVGLRRYLAVGISGGVLSAAIFFAPVSFSAAWLILGLLWLALLAPSGIWALRHFVAEDDGAEGG